MGDNDIEGSIYLYGRETDDFNEREETTLKNNNKQTNKQTKKTDLESSTLNWRYEDM